MNHPDHQFASDLVQDLQFGCRIGYQGPRHHRITPNLKYTLLHPGAVTEALLKEVIRGHTAGPFSSLPLPTLKCSPLGLVPKKDGSWLIIMDLCSPRGSSINDFISKEDYTLNYATFDHALALVSSLGTGALMAKLDLKHTFRLCPMSPSNWDLLGMHWQGKFYVDLRQPFGLRSSPFLFNCLADAFEWILKYNYAIPALMHYLNNYFTVGPPSSPLCASQVDIMVKTADRLGIPLAPDKLEGPTSCLVCLGILTDSTLMECSLPRDKLSELVAELHTWSSRKKCIKRELLSLIGKLNFACRIIAAGRIFLRRLIDLSNTAHLPLIIFPLTLKLTGTSLGGLSISPSGTAMLLSLIPFGQDRLISSSTLTHLEGLALAFIFRVAGSMAPGPPTCLIALSCGRSSTP